MSVILIKCVFISEGMDADQGADSWREALSGGFFDFF